MKKSSSKKSFVLCGILAFLAIAFTFAVKFIDVKPIGPEESSVGFSSINLAVHNLTGYSDLWYKITKYSGYCLILPVALFALIGLMQLIKQKSFKKVSRELKLLLVFYVAVVAIYLFFEKVFIVNSRPVLMDGVLEASYPSSHTLFAIAACGSAILLSQALISRKYRRLFNVAMLALMFVTVIGRLLSGVHWLTDIIGGVLIANMLLAFLIAFVEPKKSAEKSEPESK